jgi:hypothetical protein
MLLATEQEKEKGNSGIVGQERWMDRGWLERLTFSWSMWRSSLISRSVRLASILLSKALAIFLMATCSAVSELSAELGSRS